MSWRKSNETSRDTICIIDYVGNVCLFAVRQSYFSSPNTYRKFNIIHWRVYRKYSYRIFGRIEGTVNTNEGPLEIYVIHSDDYVNLSSINIIDCIVYEYDLFLEFRFDVTREGEWVLVLRNPNAFNVTFGFTWSSYDPDEGPIISSVSPVVFSLFLFLIGLGYVITVQRGVYPEVRTTETNSFLPAIVGLVFIGLSLLLPSYFHLTLVNASSSSDNVLVSLLWKLTITVDGFSFQLVNFTNPYAGVLPLLFMGSAFFYPFALMSYYQGRITKRHSVKIGFIGILPILYSNSYSV